MSTSLADAYTTLLTVTTFENFLLDVIEKSGLASPNHTLSVTLTPSIGVFSTTLMLKPSQREHWKNMIGSVLSPLKSNHFVSLRHITVTLAPIILTLYTEDDITTKILVRRSDGQALQANEQEIVSALFRTLDRRSPIQLKSTLISDALPQVQRDQLSYQQSILAQLQSTAEKITTGLAEFTVQAHKDLQSRQAELELSLRNRQAELDAAFQRRQADLDVAFQTKESELFLRMSTREDAVAQREQEVQRQKAELDLRDATAARRAHQKQIQQIIDTQSTIKITKDTAKKRWIIHGLCAIGVTAFGALALTFLFKIIGTTDNSFHWQLALPFSTGLIGSASTLVYWIKWSDDWFREHARAEFANRKFNADASRAAWLVELLLEWSKEGREAIPPVVVESLTKNLFTETASEAPSHASDVLQRFVSRLANIRVDSKGIEMGASDAPRAPRSPS